ncbi:ABC transporter ATP-binding protein [Acuticoccus kandeliae]|uniref:ABC transporter ATP-binding protein n=1 Tax=Acuticoccus kandeliae TaxID=2073160 RepID=UPI000D3EC0EA|nr:ABC transporter ATP-binding protein [Acuticoccus kandeliae]
MSAILAIDNLVAGYHRDLPIVHGASLDVAPGEVVVLLGPNGAGKSTLMKAVAGLTPTFSGTVSLDGRSVEGQSAEALTAAGLGFVPQLQNVFVTLTVDDNLRAGAYSLPRATARKRIREAYERFPDLAVRRRNLGGQLSGGQRQMLAVARALILTPRILLLDEPSAGLSPKMAQQIFASVREIAASGVAILMVEQNVRAGLSAADRAVVLAEGRVALAGPAAGLNEDPRLKTIFLGGEVAA